MGIFRQAAITLIGIVVVGLCGEPDEAKEVSRVKKKPSAWIVKPCRINLNIADIRLDYAQAPPRKD
jgi:hypothetical protein